MKNINENLCIIAGAHATDGHISRKGSFSIKDEDKNNINLIVNLINKEFNFSPKLVKSSNENSYGIQFMKKEFYRLFNEKFDFPFGPKTHSVRMTFSIKGDSNLERAFVSGAMTFESSVNINKSITFGVVSKNFRDDLSRYLRKEGMKIIECESERNGNRKKQYTLRTSENIDKKEFEKWLNYFIKDSEKWYKLLEFSNGFFGITKNLRNAKKSFEFTYNKGKRIKIVNLIEILKNLNQTDTKYLCNFLCIGKSTVTKYLRILEECNVIHRTKTPSKLNLNNISRKVYITLEKKTRKKIFFNLNRYTGHDAKICRLLKINDFVYCRWKNGERGIPFNKLKVLLKLSKCSKGTNLNIERTDREIIMFNKNLNEWRIPWRPWIKNINLDINNLGVKRWIIER